LKEWEWSLEFSTRRKNHTHHVQVIDDSIDNYVKKIIELSQKAKVLVVVNTVRKAIELREKLKDKLLMPSYYTAGSYSRQKGKGKRDNEIL
jgi:hypothetical protein